ncbi:MAG: iron-containing alcohol dehydrogenase, partial [Victivallaceae bacterium]
PDPTLYSAEQGVLRMKSFQPDLIMAFGGGSAMDAAKIMWLLYEHPEIDFQDIAMRFMDIRKRVFGIPQLGAKAKMVAIPTTSGTGSEVTPFAVITDEKTGNKYPLADYALTPNMAIIDTKFVMTMPKKLTAYSGFDAISHGLEAIGSIMASDYTNALAKESLRILMKYLPRAYNDGATDEEAREKVHNAATMAGMAFANAFLGICHSMAHKMGGAFHVPHGLANAILLNEVIRYNATDCPTKQGTFSQYKYPSVKQRYADVAEMLNLEGKNADESIENLLKALDDMRHKLDIPMTFQAAGVPETEFLAQVDEIAEKAFDDQCTGANPRYPLISELKAMLMKCYYGK